MLLSLALDQCYYIRLQTKSRLHLHHLLPVVSLIPFVSFFLNYNVSSLFLFLWKSIPFVRVFTQVNFYLLLPNIISRPTHKFILIFLAITFFCVF